uniref:Uncharacterized protein n=1 Tax=Oryza rufipogon TaxID=4529 RepID=A0A0E0QGI1_ORYRU
MWEEEATAGSGDDEALAMVPSVTASSLWGPSLLLGTLPKREKWLGLERLARGATGTSSSGRGDGNGDLRAPSGGGQGLGSRNTCREARPLLWLTGVAFSLVASSLGNSHVFLRSDLRHYHYHCDY